MAIAIAARAADTGPLAGTTLLTGDQDRSEEMRSGIERYLDRETAAFMAARGAKWQRDNSSATAFAGSVAPNRGRFARAIGAVEPRQPNPEPQYIGTTSVPARIAESDRFTAYAVRWSVYDDVDAEGIWLEPKTKPVARVVALPDADQTPEEIAGIGGDLPAAAQFARRLAENGCQVLIPMLINRRAQFSGSSMLNRFTNEPHREWIYRQAYTFGRHIIGYEVHKVLAAVDWFSRQNETAHVPIAVAGWGEGGLLAFHSAAIDTRIDGALVGGYFGSREQLWDEPIYRNVFGLLREFGDAEIASLISPRLLIVDPSAAPVVSGPPAAVAGQRASAAAGRITTPDIAAVRREFDRARQLCGPFAASLTMRKAHANSATGIDESSVLELLQALKLPRRTLAPAAEMHVDSRWAFSADDRQRRQVAQLEEHTQRLIAVSRGVREDFFWKPAKLSTPEAWDRAMAAPREILWRDIVGQLPRRDAPLNVRTRVLYDHAESIGYEVVMDALPEVTLWGYLLLPKALAAGERRPVVVAQHGLSGLPADLINEDPKARANRVYKAFATQLVNRGYVVFVPHFPWRAQEDYKRLQRKANPLGLSVFSFILAHHGRLLDWLETQPFVDPRRIGLYGLSWGGKVAIRVPGLERRYALSIASGDFNEWIWKNATMAWPSSYMFAPEPDMFDFNLGMTFGHAEMAAMIAPRPFMVERGHDDGVGTDEMVSFEYAKVRRLYDKLGIPGQTEITYFNSGHEIRGVETFNFIDRHFNWRPTAKP
ncbi:MAG: dienelactone hydrolase family protein [Opitutaceae bacterium]|nr:dienelactone hydrolase family protein [Opitutaceae bacterium]